MSFDNAQCPGTGIGVTTTEKKKIFDPKRDGPATAIRIRVTGNKPVKVKVLGLHHTDEPEYLIPNGEHEDFRVGYGAIQEIEAIAVGGDTEIAIGQKAINRK